MVDADQQEMQHFDPSVLYPADAIMQAAQAAQDQDTATPDSNAPDGDPAVDDPVDHPAHYNTGSVEVIDAIREWGLGFCLGNAVKYIARADHKGNREQDLKKAIWYLLYAIDHNMN